MRFPILTALEILEDTQRCLINEEFDEFSNNTRLMYKLIILEDAKEHLRNLD